MSSKDLIQNLELIPHPEGGYFKEIYRNKNQISDTELTQKYSGKRNLATSIYFLLESGQVSKLHQLKSDEIWYFHKGSPLLIHLFDNNAYNSITLGSNNISSHQFQAIIPAGTIFGAEVLEPDSFTLIGCMVSPGFHFDDFRLVAPQEMIPNFPNHISIIQRLT